MKNYLILFLTFMMIGALTVTASASPIGANVPPGFVIELDGQFSQGFTDFCPSFVAGLGDKVALGVMYDTYFKVITVSGRYVIVKNVAADLYYRLDGSSSWMADLRGKYFFNQSLAVAGKLYYDSLNTSNLSIFGQAEYMFNEQWVGNAGVIYSDKIAFLVLGAAFVKGNVAVGFDCAFPTSDFSRPGFEVVVDYLIKR